MQRVLSQRLGVLAIAMVLAASAAMLLLMFGFALPPQTRSSRIAGMAASATAGNPLGLSVFDQPREMPEIHFIDAQHHKLTLADFRGKVVLLNIWATWCVPCRKEMPALDRLQAKLGGNEFTVLPVSIDHAGLPAIKQFYKELGLRNLGIYVDSSGAVARAIGAPSVPTSLLIDRQGREVARKMGAAEWDAPHMLDLIRQQIEVRPAAETGGPR